MKHLLISLLLLFSFTSKTEAYTPKTLDIPRLNFQYPIPIVEVPLENGQWNTGPLGEYVGWLESTPWLIDNTLLAGHNFSVFSNLEQNIQIGDEIIITDENGKHYFYVYDFYIVNVLDVSPTALTGTPIVTLITCSGQNSRFIVKAK